MYFSGCRKGVDYPEEYRNNEGGFNVNSPVNYCNDEKDKWENYIDGKLRDVGKRKTTSGWYR